MNKVQVMSLNPKYRKFESRVKRLIREVLKVLKKDEFLIEVFLIDNKRMRSLNREFLGKDGVTNVLSFEEVAPLDFIEKRARGGRSLKRLGEMYFAPDFILKESQNFSKMVIHGLLHLFGYKHEIKGDMIEMQKQENRTWARTLSRV